MLPVSPEDCNPPCRITAVFLRSLVQWDQNRALLIAGGLQAVLTGLCPVLQPPVIAFLMLSVKRLVVRMYVTVTDKC